MQAKYPDDAGSAFRGGWIRLKDSRVIAANWLRAGWRAGISVVIAVAAGCAPAPVHAAPSPAAVASPVAQPSPAKSAAPAAASGAGIQHGASGASAKRVHRGGKSTGNGASKAGKNDDAASPFGAFGGSNRGPVNIQSDSLSLDYKNTTTTFNGHVHATQADGVLTSDKLIVKHGKDFNDVQQMFAEGNVRISQGLRWCTSDHAALNQAAHTVVLTGSPVCHDANDQIAGNKITVHLDSGKSEVEGVKALIFPRESKTRDNGASADHMK